MHHGNAILLAAAFAATGALAFWPFAGDRSEDFEFARDGRAKAAIVVGREGAGYRFAANELADYLAKLTDARFAVVDRPVGGLNAIYVGDPKGPAKRPFEELEIAVRDGETLVLDGDGPRGTLYAVYEMLEDMGVGFYMVDWDYLPPVTNRLALAAGYRKRAKPWMVCRKSWSGPTWGGGMDSFRYQMRLRYHDSNGTRDLWAKYGMGEAPSYTNAPSYSIGQTLCSHYIARKKFFDEKKAPKDFHPEWYAWHAEGNARNGHFVCVSNREMFEQLCREVEADILKERAARPGERIEISIGLDDGSVRCDCRDCMALSEGVPNRGLAAAACQYIELVNRLARHFAARYPEVRFNILSYDGFGPTPANHGEHRLEPNAGVGFALLWRNFGRPIAACERAPASVADWCRLTPNGIANWDYYANFNCWFIPFPNLDTMGENWRYYKRHNINRMDSQNQWSVLGDLAELHFWLYSKLSWDPDADDRALIERFCRDVYGAGAKHVLEYIDFLHHCRDRQRGLWTGCYVLATDGYLSGADCVRIYRLFCEAEGAVRNDPDRKRNVARAKFGVLALAGMRYRDMVEPAKRLGVRLPPREKLLKEFCEIGARNADVGNGALWAGERQSYESIQALFRGEEKPTVPPAQAKSRFIGGDELQGGRKAVRAKDADGATIVTVDMKDPAEQLYSIFMADGNRDVSYTLKEGEGGEWYAFATLKTDSLVAADPAAAYFSFRQPFANDVRKGSGEEEIVSLFVAGEKGDAGWRTVSFGKYPIRAGARLFVFPGVVHPLGSYAVRSFALVSAAVMDDERNAARYLGAGRLKALGGAVEKERFDGFPFARVGDGVTVAADAKVVATLPKESAGARHLLARVRIGSKAYLATDVARLTLRKGEAVLATAKVGGSPYDDSWQIVSLGKHVLEAGMTVELALSPGAEARFLDVRNIWAVEPELMESSVR